LSFVLALLAATACPPYRELRAPRITRDRSVLFLSRSVDPDWFACARKAGGKLKAYTEVERAGGVWGDDHTESNTSADVHIGAWASNYCSRSGQTDPVRVRFVIKGEGALEPMSYTSEARPALCGCTVYPSTDLRATPTPAGLSLHASLTAAHVSCLREEGSSLEIRAYTGQTLAEAKAKTKPAWVLRGVDAKAEMTAAVPRKALCAGGAKEAVFELAGRGTMGELTGSGETEVHLDCQRDK
jgi:hypothetical protein